MKKLLILLFAPCLFSCGMLNSSSGLNESEAPTAYIQEEEQLWLDSVPQSNYINFKNQIGRWYPYMQYENYMTGKTADEFRQSVREMFTSAANEGVNTVYLHVHPNGDAYYNSKLFPKGSLLDGDYDPLAIMTEEAHKLGLSVHAWINPLRLQTIEQMNSVPESYITKQWVTSGVPYVKEVSGRWYLDPAYNEVTQLISDCVKEILDNYAVDGVHIDDYFYPTTDPEFDRAAFEASGSDDLSKWRMDNCTRFVKAIYDTVKAKDKELVFGISPQGSISGNYSNQFADVKLWAGENGYCDYIVPQIYYGFKNTCCPFEATLAEWESIRGDSEVAIIVGLAGYKTGKEDKWAGAAGENEWIDDPDIIEKQIEAVKKSKANGYAIYY